MEQGEWKIADRQRFWRRDGTVFNGAEIAVHTSRNHPGDYRVEISHTRIDSLDGDHIENEGIKKQRWGGFTVRDGVVYNNSSQGVLRTIRTAGLDHQVRSYLSMLGYVSEPVRETPAGEGEWQQIEEVRLGDNPSSKLSEIVSIEKSTQDEGCYRAVFTMADRADHRVIIQTGQDDAQTVQATHPELIAYSETYQPAARAMLRGLQTVDKVRAIQENVKEAPDQSWAVREAGRGAKTSGERTR